MKLLYRTAEWHGFAKLRMHTDFTLDHLEELTKEFGLLMRQFRDLSCSHFQTVELPREVEARKRRQQLAQEKNSPTSSDWQGYGQPAGLSGRGVKGRGKDSPLCTLRKPASGWRVVTGFPKMESLGKLCRQPYTYHIHQNNCIV
jgi:hypothetical protein